MESVFLQVQSHMVQLQVNFIYLLLLCSFVPINLKLRWMLISLFQLKAIIRYYMDKTELIPGTAVE
jgi:hypothetical protein